MISVESSQLWNKLTKLAENTSNIKAAVAYVSDDTCIKFGKDDILVVDASASTIASGGTSARVLEAAYQKGAKLFSCDSLHGKVIVFDDATYIGSANISAHSLNHLNELGLLTDEPKVISGAICFIDELINISVEIDEIFIKNILEIVVTRNTSNKVKKKNIDIKSPNTWLVSISNDYSYPGDHGKVEKENEYIKDKQDKVNKQNKEKKGTSWFWFRKGSKLFDEAKAGDSVVLLERESRKSTHPDWIYKHCIIKSITTDGKKPVKVFHYIYEEDAALSWKEFQKLVKKSGISRIGSGTNNLRKLTNTESDSLFKHWPY